MYKALLSALLCIPIITQCQILINEVASTNSGYFSDADSDHPDWIEIYNAGSSSINLNGYTLSDGNNWDKWIFPDTVVDSHERLIVYASGKNRNCQSCTVSPVDHWETAVFDNDIWEYKVGTSEPPANWNSTDFTDTWSTAAGGFGYGDGDDAKVTTVGYPVYYRKEFTITDKSKIISAIISMDYDDGYVIYINDVEVARMNMTGVPTHSSYANYWHEALMYGGDLPKSIQLDSSLLASLLVDGDNVIAVQVHDYFGDDLTGRTWLHFGITDDETFFSPNPDWFNNPGTNSELHANFKITNQETISIYDAAGIIADSIILGNLQVDHVLQRLPDAGGWCYSDSPTAGLPNAGACYAGYADAPVLLTDPGFYDDFASVEISGTDVYYTTDGSDPDVSSAVYSVPINLTSTGVVKAIRTEAGKLPSPVITGTYFIDEGTTLPVVSVTTDPCNMFLEEPDCIAAYDNAEGWFNRNPIVPVTVEYYDTAHVKQFISDFKLECVGNYSISLAQKSMRFVNDEDYGSGPEITYNIFEKDKPGLPYVHGFRVRNQDQDYSGTRMKDIIVNRLGLPTHAVSTGYQNVAVFINGEYWGLYGAREEMDEYFLRDNFGVDPEKVDLMKTGYGGEEKTIAEAGSDTGYYALIDFLLDNDMSIDANYAQAKQMIDAENWVDYFATEIYAESGEWLAWLENNIRLFRSYEPDIKWRYMFWDCSNSQFTASDDMLTASLNTFNNSVYAQMFKALLENTEFHDYFINRFADLMNYYFTVENDYAIVDFLKAEMGPEITAQNSEWGTGNFSYWSSNVNSLYDFYEDRNYYQRNHIENYFDLDDQLNITLNVNPPGAGFVQISTIVPQELPWTGVYFEGVPVKVSAIANPGYTFTEWDDNAFITSPTDISFTKNITSSTSFTANFTGSSITNPIVITEINYNSDSFINAGDWIELYNNSDVAINVSNYSLSEKFIYSNFTLPANTIIAPHDYLVLTEDSADFYLQHPDVLHVAGDFHFSLQNDSDIITLKDLQNNVITSFMYNSKRPWPFTAGGYGRTMELVSPSADASLPASWFEGCIGGSPGKPFTACFENPLIDEINYKSAITADAGDWFEIENYGTTAFDIGNWTIQDKNRNIFVIPEGTSIPSTGYIVFYQDGDKFGSRFPTLTNAIGPVNFGFDGNGDVILLYNAEGILFQSVGFDDAAPYPLSPDGGGTALQISNVAHNINDPLNWEASCPEGSPGAAYETPCFLLVDDEAEQNFMIYPNPADDIITISGMEDAAGSIIISDVSGKELLRKKTNGEKNLALDISGFTDGIYFIRFIVDDNIQSAVFVKNN